jgi:large subunit ribosomal protein L31
MKDKIHPEYYPEAVIGCACGNKLKVGSTKKNIEVEVCANCHPFYTGKQKLVDAAGRIDRFKKRLVEAEKAGKEENEKRSGKNSKKAKKKQTAVQLN